MLEYGGRGGSLQAPYGGGQDFAAMPRVVATKAKYKDPYGGDKEA